MDVQGYSLTEAFFLCSSLATALCFQIMSGSLEKLVPMLDRTNWHKWEVNMTAFLQMQELWK
jgi:hypothetical protein